MGQKVHPIGLRLGIVRSHDSVWFATGERYRRQLLIDIQLRTHILERLREASVGRVIIERPPQNLVVTIHSARPGTVLGQKGQAIDALRADLEKMTGIPVDLKVVSIEQPDLEAKLVAENIARQLETRVAFRRALKRGIQHSMRSGAKGIRVQASGRLGGADIARTEAFHEGSVPLHTLRADIDYAVCEARTTYGVIGVKVWIFRGEIKDPVESTQPGRFPEAGGVQSTDAAGAGGEAVQADASGQPPCGRGIRKNVRSGA